MLLRICEKERAEAKFEHLLPACQCASVAAQTTRADSLLLLEVVGSSVIRETPHLSMRSRLSASKSSRLQLLLEAPLN